MNILEKENLFNILDFWNYWNKQVPSLNNRDIYLDQIKMLENTEENIVLKWIRRSWKSTILNLKIDLLLKSGVNKKNILFINFEEPQFFWNLTLELLERIWETYVYYLEPNLDKKIYIFLDEIQNIKAWEKWVLKFYENKNIQFFITGSSSKLLSKEFRTSLAWRHLSINIFPLNFKEFLTFNNLFIDSKLDIIRKENGIKKLFEKYINYWGFPKVTLIDNEKLKKEQLSHYLDTIIIKDIWDRYNLSNTNDLKRLTYYLLSNDTKLFSVNNLSKINLWAYDTIKKYISFLKETYLFYELQKFDYSIKKQLINKSKIYSIDLWFVNLLWFNFSENIWRNLENIVFLELKRQNKDIYYHKEKQECDFVIFDKNKIKKAIQVTYSFSNSDTKKREILWLCEALSIYKLDSWLILTYDEDYEFIETNKLWTFNIKVQSIWKWLLSK